MIACVAVFCALWLIVLGCFVVCLLHGLRFLLCGLSSMWRLWFGFGKLLLFVYW